MKSKKAPKGKGKDKRKSKHGAPIACPRKDLSQGITPSANLTSSEISGAQPSSPGTMSPQLPDHESAPRRGDEIKEHETPRPDGQSPITPLYADIVTGRQQPEEIRTTADIEHHNMPPQDPRSAKTYADVLKQASAPPANHHAATRSSGTTSAHDLPSVKSLAILDYSSKDHDDHFSLIKLQASKNIRVGADFEEEEVPKIKEICEPHVGFIKSVQNLGGFLKNHPLMGHVKIFRGRMTILLPTAQGSLLAQTMVAAIWECHLQNRSWNGTFDIEHIRIIEPRKSDEFMMILKDPVEFEGKALLQAKANDLDKAAAIFRSLYMVGDDYALYFDEFIQDLKEATSGLAANERAFMEYLSYHPAVLPSTGRSIFVSRLSNIRTGPFMLSKSPAYPNDWKTIVESEINGEIKAQDINYDRKKKDTDTITVLYTVYGYTNNYDHTMSGVLRFMRNVLAHGKEHDDRVIHGYELELYLAKMFSGFLPITLRSILMSGRMELYGEDWSYYKISKRNKWEPAWSELITVTAAPN